MTTVATTLKAEGQGTDALGPDPYRAALAYLLALVRAQAPLRETKALASTGILEARKHGRTDSHRMWHWRDDKPVDITILAA
jgi:hypothetical protein